MRIKRRNIIYRLLHISRQKPKSDEADVENCDEKIAVSDSPLVEVSEMGAETTPSCGMSKDNLTSRGDGATAIHTGYMSSPVLSSPTLIDGSHSHFGSLEPSHTAAVWSPPMSTLPQEGQNESSATSNCSSARFCSPSAAKSKLIKYLLNATSAVRNFILSLLTPASMTIIVSFPISIVTPLKALFLNVPGSRIRSAPDGQPPLAFILDTATFIGAASIPLGLICLGSSLARLNVPRKQWSSLPFGAIMSLAIGKLLILPVFGVLICQGLVHVGVIPAEDKVLRFVCMFLSCLPTATTQVFLTQVYSGTGSAEHLSAFLIPQYVMMIFSMTAFTAYILQLIF
ncbi:hypothetical protein AX17_005566 [Amanita inopinata Kibby_2008]|nr:hypothetical protein AX17_005566 [Amanita inopinata Kibby_2008]